MTTGAMTRTDASAEPMFQSTHAALVFAFNFSMQQYDQPAMAKLMGKGIGSGKGLVGTSGAAQAGMVLAAVERLDPIHRAAIYARFAPKFEECPCCGGDKPTENWQHAVERLAAWAVPSGISHMRSRRMLIAKFFGVRGVEIKTMSNDVGLNRNSLAERYREIGARLKKAEDQAQVKLDDEFKQRGLVG